MTHFDHDQAQPVSSHFHVTHMLTETDVALDGGVACIYLLDEYASHLNADAEQEKVAQAWRQFMSQLEVGSVVRVYRYRDQNDEQCHDSASSDLNSMIRVAYESALLQSGVMHQYGFCALCYYPPGGWQDAWSGQQLPESYVTMKRQFETLLSTMRPNCLSIHSRPLSLLEVLSLAVNGGCAPVLSPDQVQFNVPDKSGVSLPAGHLGSFLACRHVQLNRHIQYQAHARTRYAELLSMKHYPTQTQRDHLRCLDQTCIAMLSCHVYQPVVQADAQRQIDKKRSLMQFVGSKSQQHIAALSSLETSLSQDEVSMGSHQHSLLVLCDTESQLSESVSKIKALYASVGINVISERLGLALAFWGMSVGGERYLSRLATISATNFVDFCCVAQASSGATAGYLGDVALCHFVTDQYTRYRFHCHLPSNGRSFSLGHGLIVGGSGCGKTVLLNFLVAQLARYGGASFFFDRDAGAKSYILAAGGTYVTVAGDSALFNPFALVDNSENRQFIVSLLVALCGGEQRLTAADKACLSECVHYTYTQLPPHLRLLRYAIQVLPLSFPARHDLMQWCHSLGDEPDGHFAAVFDNEEEGIDWSQPLCGFDMTALLDHGSDQLRAVVLYYVMHRIQQQACGQRISIILDEAWQVLNDDFWQPILRRWLPTMRKRNVHILFATQSLVSVIASPLRQIIVDNLATTCLFPNGQALRSDYVDEWGLTQAQYDVIKAASDMRSFMLLVNQVATMLRFDLSQAPQVLELLLGRVKLDTDHSCDLAAHSGQSQDGDLLSAEQAVAPGRTQQE